MADEARVADDAVAVDVGVDGGVDGPQGDGGLTDAEAADVADAALACPGMAGPAAVRVGSYCVDSTEVTNRQYAAFLDAGLDAATAPFCTWKQTYVPLMGWPSTPGTDDSPVIHVDWCDAFDYCAWAGKRLCGRIDAGANPPQNLIDPAFDQWHRACTHDGDHLYPYGDSAVPRTCNTLDGPGNTKSVGSSPGCQGGYPGLYDMVGNVAEWVDSCYGSSRTSACVIRGGAYDTDAASSGTYRDSPQRDYSQYDVGFRCCSS